MKINAQDLTEEDIRSISVGDIIYYTSGAPQMGGNKITSTSVISVEDKRILFKDGNGVLKKNIKRGNCLKIVAIEFFKQGAIA